MDRRESRRRLHRAPMRLYLDGESSSAFEMESSDLSAGGVFVEGHVEAPVQAVLDVPVGARDPEQLLGGEALGEQEDAADRLVGIAPAVDAGDGHEAREAVAVRHVAGSGHDRGAADGFSVDVLSN